MTTITNSDQRCPMITTMTSETLTNYSQRAALITNDGERSPAINAQPTITNDHHDQSTTPTIINDQQRSPLINGKQQSTTINNDQQRSTMTTMITNETNHDRNRSPTT
jgi:hypothetical protein